MTVGLRMDERASGLVFLTYAFGAHEYEGLLCLTGRAAAVLKRRAGWDVEIWLFFFLYSPSGCGQRRAMKKKGAALQI